MKGGKLIRIIGGESVKTANYIRLTATHDDLTFNAPQVNMVGKQNGVTFHNNYKPPLPLRVMKVDGLFDEQGKKVSVIEKGVWYSYKVVQYNRKPTKMELQDLKWATQDDDGSLYTNYPTVKGDPNVSFKVKNACSKFTVYAYFERAIKDASVTIGVNKFHYQGTKKWGKLQSGFATEYSKITEQQIKENTNTTGKININQLRGKTLEQVKESYEGLVFGVRRVLSEQVADKVIHNFYYGKGKKLSFKDWKQFQSDLEDYPYFQQYFKNYLEVIKHMLKENSIQTKDGDEIIKIFDKKVFESRSNFSIKSDILKYDFYGLMGGTQTVKVDLEIEEQMPGTYEVKTKMYIGDWYGSDWDDINGTLKGNVHSLQAFFWLQHYFGCQPFETEIYYKSTDYISL